MGAEERVRLVEVGPRDGLQNEKAFIPTEAKIRFVEALAQAGAPEIEAGAFVSPKAVPQLADSAEVFKGIARKAGVTYSALVPNEQGLDRALEAGAGKIAVFTAASETFNQNNIRAGIDESIARFSPVARRCLALRLPLRGYVSTAFWCPFEGKIKPIQVLAVLKQLEDLGIREFSIGDTIGKAEPNDVRRLLDQVLRKYGQDRVYLHFHDTYEQAVVNAITAWREYRITGFDSSAGGVGGCPYAPGASGNVSTEALLTALREVGAAIPGEPEAYAAAFDLIRPHLSPRLPKTS